MSPFYTAGKVKPAGLSCACTAPYTLSAQLSAVPHLTAADLRFAPVSGPFLVPMIKTKVTSATSLLQKHSFLVPGACGRTRTGDILPGAALYRLSYTSILGNQNCTGGAATLPLLRPGHIGKGGNVKRENASRCRVQGWLPAAVWQLCPAYGQETGVPVPRCERRCTMEGQNRRISHPRCLWHDTILARIYPKKATGF